MVLSPHQNAGKNNNLLTDNKSFENVAKFNCLGTTPITQNYIQEEIRNRLNSGNAFYHSVLSVLSSGLL
jgi:hypothetical protein